MFAPADGVLRKAGGLWFLCARDSGGLRRRRNVDRFREFVSPTLKVIPRPLGSSSLVVSSFIRLMDSVMRSMNVFTAALSGLNNHGAVSLMYAPAGNFKDVFYINFIAFDISVGFTNATVIAIATAGVGSIL